MLEAVGAERAILSILLKNPELVFEIDDIVGEADFTNTGSKLIYGLIKDLVLQDRDGVVDYNTIISRAEEKGIDNFLKLTQNGQLLEALTQTNVNPDSLARHVNAVKTTTIKRDTIDFLDVLKVDVEKFDGDAPMLRSLVEDQVFKTMQRFDTGDDEIERMDSEFAETINSFAETDDLLGLDVKLPRWQRDCGGLRNGTVTGIFARAKAGKSQFSAHCGVQVAMKHRLPVLYLDTELQLRMQQMRTAGIMTGIPYSRIESGAWKGNKEEVEKIKKCFEEVKDAPFYYKNIAGRSYQYVIPIIRKWFHKYVGESIGDEPCCLVIYDYIKLMDMKDIKNAAEYQVLGFLLSAIHDVAAQLNIPILALGQLNREALKVDNEATIAGSDRITHNVDSLTIMRPKKREELDMDGEERGNYMFKTILSRNGPGHDFDDWINVHFDKGSGQFKEDKRNQEVLAALQGMNPVAQRLAEADTTPLGELREE